MEKMTDQQMIECMNEEILTLREEVSELWWTQNGWKFKHKDKWESFRFCKAAYKAMPNCSRKGKTSEEILTQYFLDFRKAKDAIPSDS